MSKLSYLPIGQEAFLADFESTPLSRRLLTMGVLPGQSIKVLRKQPFGGSLYVKIEDRHFAIRESEALQIMTL